MARDGADVRPRPSAAMGQARSFAMTSPDQFLPAGPPDLTSQAYADAVNKTESLAASTVPRVPPIKLRSRASGDGPGTYTPSGAWNQIAERDALSQGVGLNAKRTALRRTQCRPSRCRHRRWNTKYNYGFWCPDTAIENADQDGNAATIQDPNWQPLISIEFSPNIFRAIRPTARRCRYPDQFLRR